MIKRLLTPSLLLCAAASIGGCPNDDTPIDAGREPYIDEWETVLEVPGSSLGELGYLSIGDRETMTNFANRGDVEVRYDPAATGLKVEMQRFTIAKSQDIANDAFDHMQVWIFDAATPARPNTFIPEEDGCFIEGATSCYIRAYYDGQSQPVRDGANFRITLPAGWDGKLDIITEDNLEEGVGVYPDRSDVSVYNAAGSVGVDLDSGNVTISLDPNIAHFAGCSASASCEEMGFPMMCGCTDPTTVTVLNGTGQASNIVVDVPANKWYTAKLENQGTFSAGAEFVCTATIDCESFEDCVLDPAYTTIEYQERAEINWPGDPAVMGTGVNINITSQDCANIDYIEGKDDYETEVFPNEQRGNLRLCSGCVGAGG
jgi:hypothetical protein